MSTRLRFTCTVNNGARVGADGRDRVDLGRASSTIAFETGDSALTASGLQTLDLLAPVLQQLQGRGFEVVGHTDSAGLRPRNIALSTADADAVMVYLVAKGIGADAISTSGVGPGGLVGGNCTAEGLARIRRIELRVV